jgi:hypothetical protein
VKDVAAKPEPHLAVRVLEREVAHRNRVILRPDQVRKQSMGDGLNLVVLHYSEFVTGYTEEDCWVVRDTMVYGLLETHRRHNLKSFLYELYGEEDVPFVLDSGATLVSDFQAWYGEHNQSMPDAHHKPFLFAADRETAKRRRAAWMSWLFLSRKARVGRVGLTPAEQKMALRALAGETDAQLAHNPEVSTNTVRRHWRSIYKKFEQAEIHLLPQDLREAGDKPLGGDAQYKKRPFLLNYLRQHPEELRPHAGKSAGAGE